MAEGRASAQKRVALLVGLLLLPVLSLATGSIVFVPLFALPAMFILSGILFGGGDTPPDRPDSDDGGGWGPRRPSSPPDPPSAGPPLPDAEQSRQRVRDHRRETMTPSRPRRGAPERPRRAPVRPRRRA